MMKTQGKIAGSSIKAAAVLNSNNPSFLAVASLSKTLSNIRYLRINYPAKLNMLFSSDTGDSIDLNRP